MAFDAPPSSSDVVRSVAWSAAIERRSASLPLRPDIRWFDRRDFFHDNRLAVAASLDPAVDFPGSGVFRNPHTGASTLVRPDPPPMRSGSHADVILASSMRTAEQLRFRSFYLSGAKARSLAVHQRVTSATRTSLVRGVQVQSQLGGHIPFVVPRIIEVGLARVRPGRRGMVRAAADWVVEEAVDGCRVPGHAVTATAEEMLDLLAQMWHTLGVDHALIEPGQRDEAWAAFADLVEDPPPEVWPIDVDRTLIQRRVHDLLVSTRPLTVGFSHGDPGIGNVLRLDDDRLALTDWEHAGVRPVAHDVFKVVLSTPDPVALITTLDTPTELRPALSAAGAASWRGQIAIAVLLFLRGWRRRYDHAVTRGDERGNTRRMHAIVSTLSTLITD